MLPVGLCRLHNMPDLSIFSHLLLYKMQRPNVARDEPPPKVRRAEGAAAPVGGYYRYP
jgi:hypothetical protein